MDEERQWRVAAIIREAKKIDEARCISDMNYYDFAALHWAIIALESYDKRIQ
jgi:hypothetical protein